MYFALIVFFPKQLRSKKKKIHYYRILLLSRIFHPLIQSCRTVIFSRSNSPRDGVSTMIHRGKAHDVFRWIATRVTYGCVHATLPLPPRSRRTSRSGFIVPRAPRGRAPFPPSGRRNVGPVSGGSVSLSPSLSLSHSPVRSLTARAHTHDKTTASLCVAVGVHLIKTYQLSSLISSSGFFDL